MSWAQNFGWKNKAEKVRQVMVNAGHQYAKPLPPHMSTLIEMHRAYHAFALSPDRHDTTTVDPQIIALGERFKEQRDHDEATGDLPLWEPLKAGGWNIKVMMHLRPAELDPSRTQLWWIVWALRPTNSAPSEADVVLVEKIVAHMGGDPVRDVIHGPRDVRAGDPLYPLGWWSWNNTSPLFEVQYKHIDEAKDPKKCMRIVPLGAAETDGYTRLPADTYTDRVKPSDS